MGFDIPNQKRIVVSLTYIKGIGRSVAQKILTSLRIDENKKTHQLTNEEINLLINELNKKDEFNNHIYKMGNELDTEVIKNVKRLVAIKSRRGIRLNLGLTIKGRTHANGKTSKRVRFGNASKK